jgi:hypothetical protein
MPWKQLTEKVMTLAYYIFSFKTFYKKIFPSLLKLFLVAQSALETAVKF